MSAIETNGQGVWRFVNLWALGGAALAAVAGLAFTEEHGSMSAHFWRPRKRSSIGTSW